MKKEIVIYHEYLPKVGGIETVIYNLAKVIDKNGYKIVFTFKGVNEQKSLFKYAEVCDIAKL